MAQSLQTTYSRRCGPLWTPAMAHTDVVAGGIYMFVIYIYIYIYLKAAATTEAVAVVYIYIYIYTYRAVGAATAPAGTAADQHAPRRPGFHQPGCDIPNLCHEAPGPAEQCNDIHSCNCPEGMACNAQCHLLPNTLPCRTCLRNAATTNPVASILGFKAAAVAADSCNAHIIPEWSAAKGNPYTRA